MGEEPNRWAEVIGPCYRAESFARALRWSESEVRDAATSLTVLELTTDDGVLLYPAFQIWESQLVKGLGAVLRVLSGGTSSRWAWAQWLNGRLDDESGEEALSAIELLRAGQLDAVLRDARNTAWSWSS